MADEGTYGDVCPREKIDSAASSVCPRDAIDRAAEDVCPREAIDKAVEEVCPRESIESDVMGICSKQVPPVIGIVPTQTPEEHIFRVNDYYINSIVLSGGVPLILPLSYDMRIYDRLLPIVDGFVLTGGQDIDPRRYGVSYDDPSFMHVNETTPMRDAVEKLILDYAFERDVPLLGTCRGMQTMNVHFGGELYCDLAAEFDGVDMLTKQTIEHWQTEMPAQVTHYIDVKRGSKLHEVLGADSSAVNSFHHQGAKSVGNGFKAVAYASDGLIEAIEAVDKSFIMGVQWHPEFFLGEKHMGNLFSRLVNESAVARASGRLDI